jgi:flagellar hook-associated protein 1 FlgK
MLGLFGTLDLGTRSLQTQSKGVEVTGHNLANVNQPGYTRQRLVTQASTPLTTSEGSQGTGVNAVAVEQVRNSLIDLQMRDEISYRGSLEAQQTALEEAQTGLGQSIDRQAAATGTDSTSGAAGESGLLEAISGLFGSFQSLTTQPASQDIRQAVIIQAQALVTRFNQIDSRLSATASRLDKSLEKDVSTANGLLADIARLNRQISNAEAGNGGLANDLRDARNTKLESLALVVSVTAREDDTGSFAVSIGGVDMVRGPQVLEDNALETYDAGGGQILVRTRGAATPLAAGSGSIQGAIDARDGAIASLKANVNALASELISQINTTHATGYNLSGGTGNDLFTGTNAADMGLNAAVRNNPSLLQASASADARSDNQVALALAKLQDTRIAALGDVTFTDSYSKTVGNIGAAIAAVNDKVTEQKLVENMLKTQRDSVSGVSMDEEMTNMIKYQKAFQASAKLITTVDEMMSIVLNMKS